MMKAQFIFPNTYKSAEKPGGFVTDRWGNLGIRDIVRVPEVNDRFVETPNGELAERRVVKVIFTPGRKDYDMVVVLSNTEELEVTIFKKDGSINFHSNG